MIDNELIAESYQLLHDCLVHKNAVVRSRCCSMLGNMMKHANSFYSVLADKPNILTALIDALHDDDPNVRKVNGSI